VKEKEREANDGREGEGSKVRSERGGGKKIDHPTISTTNQFENS
jgi:hypothetical protein